MELQDISKRKAHSNHIFFTGFMGVGKTYWADRIAEQLELNFVDTDQWIENRTRLSISHIFKKKGEDYFRRLETDILEEIVNLNEPSVISLGGGALLRQFNLELVLKNGLLIWLKGRKSFELEDMEATQRPLYQKENLQKLYKERVGSYLKADHIVDLDRFTSNTEIENALLNIIRPKTT